MHRLIPVLAILFAIPHPTDAQEVNALHKGVRIEITPVNGKAQTGRFMLLRGDSLFYAPGGVSVRSISESSAASLAVAEVKSVRVSRGRNILLSALVKGLIGTGIGIAGGGVLGAATYGGSCDFVVCSRGQAAAAGGLFGGAVGLIVGTIYGAGTGYERWENIALPRR